MEQILVNWTKKNGGNVTVCIAARQHKVLVVSDPKLSHENWNLKFVQLKGLITICAVPIGYQMV